MSRPLPLVLRVRRLLKEEREHLTDPRFWTVQALVLALAALHAAVESLGIVPQHSAMYFLPEAFFLLPVGYAALNFGLRGSLPTALWCTVLMLPNLLLWHRGAQADGVIVQMVIVNIVAVFVGGRVDREVRARRQAEAARIAMQESESRYRSLFETSAEPVLVLDQTGTIRQANRAAADLFRLAPETLEGARLADLAGEGFARRLLAGPAPADDSEPVIVTAERRPVYIEPICTVLPSDGEATLIQAVLRDVTRERDRREELRTYASHILRAQEDERRRVARELHDDILQSLIILLRRLDATEEQARPISPDTAGAFQAARAVVEDLVGAVRDSARRLRPPALEELGLVPSLREMLDEVAARASISAEMRVQGAERRLSEEMELGIYRIAQEALRNVERHAGADRVSVTLGFSPTAVELRVADTGRGFAPPETRSLMLRQGCLGLVGMEERATLLGGRLEIVSSPGRGTSVIARMPCERGA